MMCAIEAAKRGRAVLLIDHAKKIGGKILISGGGRCNFTNLGAGPANYVSQNPHFCKSALSRYPSGDFIALVQKHAIPFHEKKLGQLFCDDSAQDIVRMLQAECDAAGAKFLLDCPVREISRGDVFSVSTERGEFTSQSLVIATGGLSIPKIGATDFGFRVAKQFGHSIIELAPALDGFTLPENAELRALAGISVDTVITAGEKSFRENILFTHSGLSGPAALQASLHWRKGEPIVMDLLPGQDVFAWFLGRKKSGIRSPVKNLLAELLPRRLVDTLCEKHFPDERPLPQVSEKSLGEFCQLLKNFTLHPSGTVGYSKAEVTRGGVNTDEISSKSMESKLIPGLFFVGEVVDVTGWLGGYNFQWAWASGWAAGQVV